MRASKIIDRKKLSKEQSSRFFVSREDLESKKAHQTLAKAFKVNPEWVRLPYFVEYNVWFQLYGPRETVDSDTSEWFKDTCSIHGLVKHGFIGGKSNKLMTEERTPLDNTEDEDIGFRLLVELPEEK